MTETTTRGTKAMNAASRSMDAPFGAITLYATADALVGVSFPGQKEPGAILVDPDLEAAAAPILDQTVAQLGEYFAGTRQSFDLPLAPAGTTFQCSAWEALRRIPFGQTRSYGWQATHLGNPKASRAVGGANGRNPISIIVPCHRVVGADGTLTGFGGGLDTKQWLLDHEQTVLRKAHS